MTVNDSLALRIVDALDAEKIPYLLAGSFARPSAELWEILLS